MIERSDSWKKFLLIFFIGVGIFAVVISAGVGTATIPPLQVAQIIAQNIPGLKEIISDIDISPTYQTIILQIRLPRILLSLLVGAGLAVSGVIFQALFQNSLADPYIIGVSSGASLGAVLAIAFQLHLVFPSIY